MAKAIIDLSGMVGLAPKFYGDINAGQGVGFSGSRPQLRTIGGKGQMAQGYWNPFRALGYMCPPTSMTAALAVTESDVTYNFDSELKATYYDVQGTNGQNGKGAWLADVDNVWYQGSAGNGFSVNNIVHLSTNTPSITDLEMYQVNGVRKLFFSYKESSGVGGDIGIISPDASATNLTWLSGTVSGAFQTGATNEVVMISADNGYMYLLDGSSLHKIDGTSAGGTNGTAYANILLFPPDMTLVDGVDWKAHLWIGVHSTNPFFSTSSAAYSERIVGIYSWDRQSISTNMQDFIPIPGARDIRKVYITPDGELRVIITTNERETQIRRYNGSTFEIIQELPVWAYPPRRDSLGALGGFNVWLGNDGKMYAHGKLSALQAGQSTVDYSADQIFVLGDMTALPNTDFTAGAILVYGSGTSGSFSTQPTSFPGIVFSYAPSGSANKIYQWIPNGVGNISGQQQFAGAGNVFTMVQRLPGLSQVNYIRVWHLPVGAGGSTTMGTFSIFKNQSAAAMTNGAVTINQDDVLRGYKYIPLGAKGFTDFALQFEIGWNTNNLNSDSADWMPYAIEVDYDPTPVLK